MGLMTDTDCSFQMRHGNMICSKRSLSYVGLNCQNVFPSYVRLCTLPKRKWQSLILSKKNMVKFVDYASLTCTPAGRNKNSTCFKPEKAELFTFCKYDHILKGAPSESINIKFTLIGLLFSKSIWMYSVPAKAYLQIIYIIRFYFCINKTDRIMVP